MPDFQTATNVSRTSQRTQARIIDAVVDVVWQRGITGTTLANVATTAGVSQGVVVFHFKSKKGLLAETLVRLFDEYRDSWLPASRLEDPLDQVKGLVRADFDPRICTPKKLTLWFAFWGEAGTKPLYNRLCQAAEQERFEAMKHAVAGLDCHGDGMDAGEVAHMIDAHTDGLWLQMHIQGKSFPADMALETALAHLRRLLPDCASRI
ncbi:MAG: TetR family transcriptional regulator C-terminal domain-containing protein [Nitratireductor sp.]